jgi:hypothetical protein
MLPPKMLRLIPTLGRWVCNHLVYVTNCVQMKAMAPGLTAQKAPAMTDLVEYQAQQANPVYLA